MRIFASLSVIAVLVSGGWCRALGAGVATALEFAGANRPELEAALAQVPAEQRTSLEWLLAHMPAQDAATLRADFLLKHVDHAWRAWKTAPWSAQVSEELFRDAILPYASVSEKRECWMPAMRERCAPMVQGVNDCGLAAVRVNQKLFPAIGVKYSTRRRRSDQSPSESMETGLASCTGLSVLLVDACRSVGIPARFVGVPSWIDREGNHSWVEVWDGTRWRFTGAAEPTDDRLDEGWFAGPASKQNDGKPEHAIYAVTWNDSNIEFPLVFDPSRPRARAEIVTANYSKGAETGNAKPLSRSEADAQRAQFIDRYQADTRKIAQADLDAQAIEAAGKRMPIWWKVYGDKPAGGRALYISMHGGGGAPAEVNDKQWDNQKKLYKPEEGVYVAPRAPTDTWDLWHQGHMDTLFDHLIRDMVLVEGVDPDRVYLMGYSAGGDGVFQLAPRMADRFAAASMMAGHPNETRPDGLRNLPFAIFMGGKDAAFKRNEIAAQWKTTLDDLSAKDPGGYPHEVTIYPENGHWMDRKDAVAVPWMAKFTRNLRPARIVWLQDDVTEPRFYWLENPAPKAGQRVVARRDGQVITIDEATGIEQLRVLLDDGMLDLDQPVRVMFEGRTLFEGKVPRTAATIARTLGDRGDPKAVFTAEVTVRLQPMQERPGT
jgi:hypothetical protein